MFINVGLLYDYYYYFGQYRLTSHASLLPSAYPAHIIILGMPTRPPRAKNILTHSSLLTTGTSTSCIREWRGPAILVDQVGGGGIENGEARPF